MKNEEKHSYKLVKESCYNPFILRVDDYRMGEISKINFFKKGEGVKYFTKWFDAIRKRVNGKDIDVRLYPISGNNGLKSVTLPYDNIPVCRKIGFDKHNAFLCKSHDNPGTYELFLNIDTLNNFTVTEVRDKPYTSRELRNETCVTFTIEAIPEDWYCSEPAREENGELTIIFYCNLYFTKTKYGEYCDKLSHLLSCKLLAGTYSDIEVDALIKDGVIDEIAKTITEFRKDFPLENLSSE